MFPKEIVFVLVLIVFLGAIVYVWERNDDGLHL